MATSVAILAGGMSRRFGSDKALAIPAFGDRSLLELTLAAGRALTNDLFVVAPIDRRYDRFGIRCVADAFPCEGPLGGVLSALRSAKHSHCLVLGCDYPLLSVPLLRWLCEVSAAFDLTAPVLPTQSRQGSRTTIEGLHAVYAASLVPKIEAAFARGERQLAAVARMGQFRRIEVEEVLRFDPGLRSFLNVNRRQDLQAIAHDWHGRRRVDSPVSLPGRYTESMLHAAGTTGNSGMNASENEGTERVN